MCRHLLQNDTVEISGTLYMHKRLREQKSAHILCTWENFYLHHPAFTRNKTDDKKIIIIHKIKTKHCKCSLRWFYYQFRPIIKQMCISTLNVNCPALSTEQIWSKPVCIWVLQVWMCHSWFCYVSGTWSTVKLLVICVWFCLGLNGRRTPK